MYKRQAQLRARGPAGARAFSSALARTAAERRSAGRRPAAQALSLHPATVELDREAEREAAHGRLALVGASVSVINRWRTKLGRSPADARAGHAATRTAAGEDSGASDDGDAQPTHVFTHLSPELLRAYWLPSQAQDAIEQVRAQPLRLRACAPVSYIHLTLPTTPYV